MKNKLSIERKKIRIISGKWKGRFIPVINQLIARPTLSRLRETLFNWLDPVIINAICLDCFAGSGALGLEALSRGAQQVTFIENNRICLILLKKTISNFKTKQHNIIYANCLNWLRTNNRSYNIVFIDPPFYNHFIIFEVIYLLENYHHFSTQAWIYIEVPRKINFSRDFNVPKYWYLYRMQSTQSLSIFLYYRNHSDV